MDKTYETYLGLATKDEKDEDGYPIFQSREKDNPANHLWGIKACKEWDIHYQA